MTTTDVYRDEIRRVYAEAAEQPDASLCCVSGSHLPLPDLRVPQIMHEMNYGCGSTVHPADLVGEQPILYVGVGGGLEALQFAYFRRFPGGVVAIDPVGEMRAAADRNLAEAERLNPWFRREFVRVVDGSAAELPVDDASVGLVAQNCLFNVFVDDELERALREVFRVLAPGGRFSTSDPISEAEIPKALRESPRLRARCVSGARSYRGYLDAVTDAGFRQIVIRARRPYRLLLPRLFPEVEQPLALESVDLVASKVGGADTPLQVFSGRCATFLGPGTARLEAGFSFEEGVPVPVSDRTAAELARRDDFRVSEPTYHAGGPGCC